MRRVVITGLGAVSPHGLGTSATWNGLLEAKNSIGQITRFDPGAFDTQIGGQTPTFKTTDFVPKAYRKATRIMARDIELAVVAANYAVKDARLATKGILEQTPLEQLPTDAGAWFKPAPERFGCNIGAGLISPDLDELTGSMVLATNPDGTFSLAKWGKSEDPTKPSGMETLTPLWMLKYLPNMLACHVSIIHDTQGPSNTITCQQASAGLSLAEAARSIERGTADLALVGGCENKLGPIALLRWGMLKRLAKGTADTAAGALRPFDSAATGTLLGEGGGVLVIEELEHAKARGARIYAEVIGLASTSSGTYVTDADETGEAVAAAIRKALRDAQIAPDAVQLVVPGSCGVPGFDRADSASIRAVFGSSIGKMHVAPIRGGIGDCGAGSQALDLVGAAMAIHSQTVPPAVNCANPIDGLPISSTKKSVAIESAVVIGSSLGGQNSAVVLKRYN